MTTVIELEEIKSLLKNVDVVTAMSEGFVQYSNGNTVVPPVGELLFDNPPGDVHIKYGYIKKDDFYVIKIASGFYENKNLGLPSSQGIMLLFNQKTGQTVAVLLDEGYLTDVRTAAAGAVAAKYFAPKNIEGIGILGTGIQAKMQLQYLQKTKPCKSVWVWGRTAENVLRFKEEMGDKFDIHIAESALDVTQNCNLIVTTTPSELALITADNIRPGTHITAVGSDTSEKQELDGSVLKKANIVVADSIPQSKSRGEIYQAVSNGFITEDKIMELGNAIQNSDLQRTSEEQITVVDLTGVAVQDIMITTAVYEKYKEENA
ncbi:ornithine cyclodeaminase family protein [Maribacter algarum]|uniref:Ornithine cyclodeaminase family protein n=1 Tax=Maribacter algarum (ex Zhang et al. 2020) TaxID=2578118 RepID=A0A5S3PWD7_9FLAO|nr:ornithine cyclodeaminase family protein [Maribacter algarum]TMM57318.1 ornithine cyclodeaminase family protein [Maribacter algarum]